MYRRSYRYIIPWICGCLLLMLAACGQTASPTPSAKAGTTPTARATSGVGSTPPSQATSQPITVTTTCPAAGTARSAQMPGGLGSVLNIIYIFNQRTANQPTAAIIRRYNTSTQQKNDIVNFPQSTIYEAHLLGVWVLFTRGLPSGQTALQLVRTDGQGLQTLYCSPSTSSGNPGLFSVQWSPQGNKVVFAEGETMSDAPIKLLDLTNGSLQTLLQAPSVTKGTISALPTKWLDDTHLYMTGFVPYSDAPLLNVYLLDLTKGANQSMSAVKQLVTVSGPCFDYDSSPDKSRLFVSQCKGTMGIPTIDLQGPGGITVQNALGGSQSTVYNSPSMAITTVRVAPSTSPMTLLFIVNTTSGDASHNGLWKVNSDGSGLTQLVGNATQMMSFNGFDRATSANFSPTDNMYTIQTSSQDGVSQQLAFGSINSTGVTNFAQVSGAGNVGIVGWAAM